MVAVVRLACGDPVGEKRWDAFVESCADATFFHRSGWQRILRDVFRHETYFLYAESEGQIVGVLPLARVRSFLFGHSLVSLPFAVYGGAAASTPAVCNELEQEAQRIALSLCVDHLELRNIHNRHADWPTQDLYVTFRKSILPDVEANMLAIPRKQRAMVRKGQKNGLVASADDNVNDFFALYADNVHRHGTPALPRTYFQALLQEFGPAAGILTVRDANGQALSAVLSFYFRGDVLPYYAGDHVLARDLAANDFKYWALMQRACEQGFQTFDFGRSKQGTGSYSFKKNWGFEPTPLHYQFQLYKSKRIPQNNPSNRKYKLMIEAWRRLPIGIANYIGPYIVRSLG